MSCKFYLNILMQPEEVEVPIHFIMQEDNEDPIPQCPVCFNGYEERIPIVAPCGHTCCLECCNGILLHSAENIWHCPLCQQVAEMPLAKNYALMEMYPFIEPPVVEDGEVSVLHPPAAAMDDPPAPVGPVGAVTSGVAAAATSTSTKFAEKTIYEKVTMEVAGPTIIVGKRSFLNRCSNLFSKSRYLKEATTTTVEVVKPTTVLEAVVEATPGAAGAGAAGAAVGIGVLCMTKEVVWNRWIYEQPSTDLSGMAWNTTVDSIASGTGAAVGTVICPGWGTAFGSVLGTIVGSVAHVDTNLQNNERNE